jgi:hypothetical protein
MVVKHLPAGWPLLLTAVVMFVWATGWAIKEGYDGLTLALLSAGLITLGAWIATEIGGGDRDDQ